MYLGRGRVALKLTDGAVEGTDRPGLVFESRLQVVEPSTQTGDLASGLVSHETTLPVARLPRWGDSGIAAAIERVDHRSQPAIDESSYATTLRRLSSDRAIAS